MVDERYRLTPADLNGRARQVMIKAVTFEGVERFTPLLHFEGVARPLALDPEQRIDMAAVAHSTLAADWVGVALVLCPVRSDEGETIALLPLDATGRRAAPEPGWTPRRDVQQGPRRSLRPVLILLALLALAFAAAYLVENMGSLTNLLGLTIIVSDVDLWENATTST